MSAVADPPATANGAAAATPDAPEPDVAVDVLDDLGPAPSLIIRSVPLPPPGRGDVRRRLVEAVRVSTTRLRPIAKRIATRQPVDNATIARSLRVMFGDLGGSFSKFGQLIGSSPSLFGEDVAQEFRGTLDDVDPIPFVDVKRTIEDELGLPLGHLFAEFDEEPIAAASVAAVHRAVLPDGRVVAVKVLRPAIEYKMSVDLAVMGPLFGFLGQQVAIGIFGELPSLISGLAEQLSEEVDLRNEARSMIWFEHLRRTLELDRLEVPQPIAGYSTKRVLAMTFVDGVPVDDVAGIEALGIEPAPLVQECVKAWFASALCTGAFHGDVHAGNVFVTRGGKLAVLDWGIVGRLDASTQHFFRRVVEGAMGDESAWADVAAHAETIYGTVLRDQLGLTQEQMVQMVRMQVEPLFLLPFGEIDLTNMLFDGEAIRRATADGDGGGEGGGDADGATPTPGLRGVELWRSERRRRRALRESGAHNTSFDRGMFLLGKQLVYFDRYGKLFLPDVPLLWDRAAFERLLAEPVVDAEVPFV